MRLYIWRYGDLVAESKALHKDFEQWQKVKDRKPSDVFLKQVEFQCCEQIDYLIYAIVPDDCPDMIAATEAAIEKCQQQKWQFDAVSLCFSKAETLPTIDDFRDLRSRTQPASFEIVNWVDFWPDIYRAEGE